MLYAILGTSRMEEAMVKAIVGANWGDEGKGYEFVQGPNGTLQKAFEDNMITDHDGWRRMAKARIATSHTYNDGKASEIVEKIYTEYSILLKQLAVRLGSERSKITGLFA